MPAVGQGHLRPRALDPAHDHAVSADVSVPVPGFLGKKTQRGISHAVQSFLGTAGGIFVPT